jgi:hypothetical protein
MQHSMSSAFHIGIKSKDGFKYQLSLDVILYVFVIENYIYFYTADGREHEKKCSMDKFISSLPSYLRFTFIRFGKNHCLNRCMISAYKSDEVKFDATYTGKLHIKGLERLKKITPTPDSINGLEASEIL